MPYKNPQELVVGLAQLPVAIEAKLPEGAPKVSQMMIDASTKGPALPDFPVELPDLPAVPELPGLPTPPGGNELRRRLVTKVEVIPIPAPAAAMAAALAI
ncbi:hypothetical protein ES703_112765 [subsurface metagenome]